MKFLKKLNENFELLFLFAGTYSILFIVVYNYLAEDSFMDLFYLALLVPDRLTTKIEYESLIITSIITCLFWIMIFIWLKIIE